MQTSARFDPIILFDGHCVFCSSSMRFVYRHDKSRRLRFAALQTPQGQAIARARGLEADDPTTFYVVLHDRTLEDADALRFVARHLTLPWAVLGLPAFLPRAAVVPLYRSIARNRYLIAGRRQTCAVPPTKDRDRFLQ